jgi:hypothetical protein
MICKTYRYSGNTVSTKRMSAGVYTERTAMKDIVNARIVAVGAYGNAETALLDKPSI